jgi:hypothetical protein
MKALRKVTQADMRESNLIYQLCLQTAQAHEAGEIDEETKRQLLMVFYRCHTNLCIQSGIVDRIRQKRLNARYKIQWNSEFMYSLAIVSTAGLILLIAWLVI